MASSRLRNRSANSERSCMPEWIGKTGTLLARRSRRHSAKRFAGACTRAQRASPRSQQPRVHEFRRERSSLDHTGPAALQAQRRCDRVAKRCDRFLPSRARLPAGRWLELCRGDRHWVGQAGLRRFNAQVPPLQPAFATMCWSPLAGMRSWARELACDNENGNGYLNNAATATSDESNRHCGYVPLLRIVQYSPIPGDDRCKD